MATSMHSEEAAKLVEGLEGTYYEKQLRLLVEFERKEAEREPHSSLHLPEEREGREGSLLLYIQSQDSG